MPAEFTLHFPYCFAVASDSREYSHALAEPVRGRMGQASGKKSYLHKGGALVV